MKGMFIRAFLNIEGAFELLRFEFESTKRNLKALNIYM